jgi:hypothetical protein
MQKVIDFLFGRASEYKPQLGFAGRDKVGRLWLPGKQAADMSRVATDMALPLAGCTQLAFEDWFKPADSQACVVCWVGLDIDSDDNEVNLIRWAEDFVTRNPVSMIRTSCGGTGLHMIWVLETPIKTSNVGAGQIVKNIAANYKRLAEADGIHVCQANRRMFWLFGGQNQTIYESDFVLSLTDIVDVAANRPTTNCLPELSPKIREYVDKLHNGRVFKGCIGKSNPIYIGDAVRTLREMGERVETRSKMSGNGQVNGYIDIEGHRLSLWSYADGHVIWSYTDVGALINNG